MPVVVIHDLGMAAYFRRIKGKKLVKPPYRDERNRFCFEFQLEDGEKEQLTMEYLDSPFRDFDQEVKDLKRALMT